MPTKQTQKSYPDIGRVTYRKNSRARRITIKLTLHGEVRVTLPYLTPLKVAEHYLLTNREWIAKKKAELNPKTTSKTYLLVTRYHLIEPEAAPVSKPRIKIHGNRVKLQLPDDTFNMPDKKEEAVRDTRERILKMEAATILPQRVAHLATQHGFTYSKLTIRKAKTRWGSCSVKNSINLSYYLILLPDHLIDYVILHELCHTLEKNHGPKFWELLQKHCGGKAKELSAELKKYYPI